ATGVAAPAEPALTAFLVTMGDAARAAGVALLHRMRAEGIRCDSDFVGRSVKAQMRESNRQAALYTLLLGDNELEANNIALKDMTAGTQEMFSVDEAIAKLKA